MKGKWEGEKDIFRGKMKDKWKGKMNEIGLENDGKWPKKQSLLISAGFLGGFFEWNNSEDYSFEFRKHQKASRMRNFLWK